MSIWAEIKKAINSNLSLPLNEKIDRDIEENRIGHGFITTSTPKSSFTTTLDGLETNYGKHYNLPSSVTHFVKYKDYFYLLGYGDTTLWKSKDLRTWETNNPVSLPYNFKNGGAFVLGDYMYIVGGNWSGSPYNYFYRFNGNSWKELDRAPFFCESKVKPINFNNKIYIYNHHGSKGSYNSVRMYDGNSWSKIPFNSDYDSFSSPRYGELFIYKNKLHLAVQNIGSNGSTLYKLNESGDSFIINDELPNVPIVGNTSDTGGYAFKFFETANNRLYCSSYGNNNSKQYELVDDKWKESVMSPIDMKDIKVIDGVIYQLDGSNLYTKDYNFYKTYYFSLPRNALVFIEGCEESWIAPIENCEVYTRGLVRVINDGYCEFRIFGDRNQNLNVMFR